MMLCGLLSNLLWHDATPNMAVNRGGGRIIIKRKIQVKMTEKISLYNAATS
jgi:hypothetical protein